jgi:DNA-binding FrmR family transcriptional regulator
MRKQMIENAVYDVATQVRAVEESIESALAELAELQARMVRARGITRAGMVSSHAAFEQLGTTTSSLIAARGGIANCHVALAETKQTIPGARSVMIGDGDECPPASGRADLRVVA